MKSSRGCEEKLIWFSLFMLSGVNAIYALDARTSTDINLGGTQEGVN
jgi:hypothetical protein